MSDDPIKTALRMMPYGFYAITSRSAGDVNAMVANWVMQAAFEPRLVAAAISKTAHSHGLIAAGKVFAINLFHQGDADAIKPFSKSRAKNPEKLVGVAYREAANTGCPILPGAAAVIECRLTAVLEPGGDHDLFIGQVVGAEILKPGDAGDMLTLPGIGWSYGG